MDTLLVEGYVLSHMGVFHPSGQKPLSVVEAVFPSLYTSYSEQICWQPASFLCVWPNLFSLSAIPESSIASGYKPLTGEPYLKAKEMYLYN